MNDFFGDIMEPACQMLDEITPLGVIILGIVLALVVLMSGCAAVGAPDNTAGAGCVEYRGQAEPGIAGAIYVDGLLDVHGCRCNATSEQLVQDFAHWCAGEGEVAQ